MADTKITDMVAGSLSAEDLLTFVDDPAGTPVNKKIAFSTLESGLSLTESQISDLGTYATTAYVDAAVVGLYDHKGAYNAFANSPDLDTSPSGVLKGDAYTVSVAGTFFATAVDAGDVLIADQDSPTLESHWTIVNRNIDESAFATASHTHATTDITSGTFADALVAESNVTQHEAALTITESQISDLGTYLTTASIDTLAELNAIVTDATLIDTTDSRLSDARTPTTHTHASTDVTDFAEAVDDRVGTMVIGGTDITATYDDGAGTLTIDSTAAGGSSLPVADTTGIAKGSSDATKIVRLEVDTNVPTGTTVVLTVPSADGTIALTGHAHAASDITSGTLTHERGGIEADISAVAIGDVLAGTGTGTIGIVTSTGHSDGDVLTIQADGTVDFETPAGGGSVAFDDLTDVDLTTTSPSSYDLLTFDGASWVPLVVGVTNTDDVIKWDGSAWTAGVAPAGSVAFDDVTDVDLTTTTPSANDLLTFDGSDWVPLVVGTPSSDDVVKWDGSAWAVGVAPAGSVAMDDLTDADMSTTSPSMNDLMTFDGSDWVPLVAGTPSTDDVVKWDGSAWAVGSAPAVAFDEDVDVVDNGTRTLQVSLQTAGPGVSIRPNCQTADSRVTFDLFRFYRNSSAPGVSADSGEGYDQGSFGFDFTNNQAYTCSTDTVDGAVWQQLATNGGLKTLTDGATVTIDADFGQTQKVTLAGNRTLAFSGFKTGQRVNLRLTQDGTGSRTVTWPSSGVTINWSGGPAPTLTTTASKADWILLICTDDSSGAEVYDADITMDNV